MQNMLLASVSPDNLHRLTPALRRVEFSVGDYLQTEGQRVEDVYFPESGLVSLMGGIGGRRIEAAMVGREGMIGAGALLGSAFSSHRAIVRMPGAAWALPAAVLRQAQGETPALQECLFGFLGAWAAEMEQTICATGRCTVEQRLARWLLMAHDRLGGDELEITHESLAATLGVRRPGVTVALHVLEGEFAIRSTRGRIMIRDRDRLKRIAGDAYCVPEDETLLSPAPHGRYEDASSVRERLSA